MTSQQIRQQFFAYRNGMLADQLRSQVHHHETIFGLNIPQIAAIAREAGMPNQALAEELWSDRRCREARLLATYLFDPAAIDVDRAHSLAVDVQTPEEADMLAFRLIKRLPSASAIKEKLEKEVEISTEATEAEAKKSTVAAETEAPKSTEAVSVPCSAIVSPSLLSYMVRAIERHLQP